VSEFHAEAPQATASEELAQSPYMAVRAGFETMTLQMKSVETTNEPPLPDLMKSYDFFLNFHNLSSKML